MTTSLDDEMRSDPQQALDCYEHAKSMLRDADGGFDGGGGGGGNRRRARLASGA